MSDAGVRPQRQFNDEARLPNPRSRYGILERQQTARCELECDPKAKCICATVLCGPLEALGQNTAVGFNDSEGSNVVGVGRDLDVSQPFSASMLQHQFQRAPGVTAARVPRHDPITNVSEHVRWQL